MTVTELGFIKGAAAAVSPQLRAAIETALAAQTRWLEIGLGPAAAGANAATGGRAWLLQQIEDPGCVLLAATWTSVAQHDAWRATEPDKAAITGAIGQHLHQPTGAGDTARPLVTVHAEGDVFAGPVQPGATRLLDSPVICVTRMFVTAGGREAFQTAFRENKIYVEEYAAPHVFQGQWRVDKEPDEGAGADKEEFVLVSGWESVAAHRGFRTAPNGTKTAAYTRFLDSWETRHYRRLL